MIVSFCLFAFYALSVLCSIFLPLAIKKFALPQKLDHQLPSLFCYFAAGMICLLNLSHLLRLKKFLFLPCAAICVFYLAFGWQFLFIFFPLSLSLVIVLIGFGIPIFFQMKDFSYGMYLVHFPILNALSFTNIFTLHPIMALFFTVAISFSCAYLLEKICATKIASAKSKILGVAI